VATAHQALPNDGPRHPNGRHGLAPRSTFSGLGIKASAPPDLPGFPSSGTPSSSDLTTIATTTHLGFTAQEQLDNLNLVDLNGRVYDPTIGRFMSADPEVQAPYRSQSLNRYSYTWDNPLNATDPTGFCSTGTHILSLPCSDVVGYSTDGGPPPNEPPNESAATRATDASMSNSAQVVATPLVSPNETAKRKLDVGTATPGEKHYAMLAGGPAPKSMGNISKSVMNPRDREKLAQQQNDNAEEAQNNPPTINNKATANYMDQHAGKSSTERCAAFCRKGLEAGGLDTSGHPVDAGDYGPFLLRKLR